MNTAREVGGRSLLGPLRRAATAQVRRARMLERAQIRAALRFATACGAARLDQRAYSSLLPPTPLAGISCGRKVVKFNRCKGDSVFQ
jgi:hypothetical protein